MIDEQAMQVKKKKVLAQSSNNKLFLIFVLFIILSNTLFSSSSLLALLANTWVERNVKIQFDKLAKFFAGTALEIEDERQLVISVIF